MSYSPQLPVGTTPRSRIRPLSLLALGGLLAIALVLTWMPELDDYANDYLDASIADAGVIYASARGLNAVISVIQSIEISISLGAGVAVNLGEVLDPLNDMIERFSAFVLTGLVGLGLQKMVLVLSSSVFTKGLTTVVLVASWLVWFFRGALPSVLKKVLWLMVLVRFAFAIEVGLCWVLDQAYFNTHQQEALSTLDIAQKSLESIREEYLGAVQDRGVFRGAWSTARSFIGNAGQESLTHMTMGALVQLLVIVLVRSILLPVLFFWTLLAVFRRYLLD